MPRSDLANRLGAHTSAERVLFRLVPPQLLWARSLLLLLFCRALAFGHAASAASSASTSSVSPLPYRPRPPRLPRSLHRPRPPVPGRGRLVLLPQAATILPEAASRLRQRPPRPPAASASCLRPRPPRPPAASASYRRPRPPDASFSCLRMTSSLVTPPVVSQGKRALRSMRFSYMSAWWQRPVDETALTTDPYEKYGEGREVRQQGSAAARPDGHGHCEGLAAWAVRPGRNGWDLLLPVAGRRCAAG